MVKWEMAGVAEFLPTFLANTLSSHILYCSYQKTVSPIRSLPLIVGDKMNLAWLTLLKVC